MKQWSHVNSAVTIINNYTGDEPFASFIKKYFAIHKKYGSKDRKQISHLCYCYFRLGKSALRFSTEERIMMGLLLCSNENNEMLASVKPEWNDKVSLSVGKKYLMFNAHPDSYRDSIFNVFPWKEELSEVIEYEKLCESFFIQPDLFLRLRPGEERTVKHKLQKACVDFDSISENCLALPNSSKLDDILELNKEAMVQDYNSQRVGEFLLTIRLGPSGRVWDCCAASGGKSIMTKDILGDIDLTVSDIRESILVNLKKRFNDAGIKNYRMFIADLTQRRPPPTIHHSPFDLILCDAPCTGSGTWSRTPEQLYYFEKEKIDIYAFLQQQIVSNVIPHLKPGGYFLYITCSVFKKENEEVIEFIKKNFEFDLIRMDVLTGYDKKADTMFAALLQKSL